MRGRRNIREEHGQTAVEFALVSPILVVLLLDIIQFGITFNNYVTLTDAARAGARKAIVQRLTGDAPINVTCSPTDTNTVCQTVRSSAGTLDATKLGISVSATDWTTTGSDVTLTATYPYSISLLGYVVKSGNLTSTMKERLE